ncbi:MAG: TonB family protein [Rhodothermales bacterium]
MLILANLPAGGPLNRLGSGAFSAPDIDFSEPLPLITVHEIPEKKQASPPLERREINTELPPAELDLANHVISENTAPLTERPVSLSALAPAALTSAGGLRDIGGSKRQLRTAIAPPPLDRSPKLHIGTMIVNYPLTALKKAIEGLVIVAFTVETDGRAHAIEVVHGLHPDCDAEVVEALENARFVPGRHEGRMVPAFSQMTVRFVLADAGPTTI